MGCLLPCGLTLWSRRRSLFLEFVAGGTWHNIPLGRCHNRGGSSSRTCPAGVSSPADIAVGGQHRICGPRHDLPLSPFGVPPEVLDSYTASLISSSQFRYGTYSRRYPLSITCAGPAPATACAVKNLRIPLRIMVLPLLLKPQQVNCIRIATFIETDIRIRPVGPLRCSQPRTPGSCMQCQGTRVMELITLMVL